MQVLTPPPETGERGHLVEGGQRVVVEFPGVGVKEGGGSARGAVVGLVEGEGRLDVESPERKVARTEAVCLVAGLLGQLMGQQQPAEKVLVVVQPHTLSAVSVRSRPS